MGVAWLSYGAGVNSTAILVLLTQGKVPNVGKWRVLFADTQDEKEETYEYLYTKAMPFARKHGATIEVCRPYEGVIERWARLGVVGSRITRACTDHAKKVPMDKHVKAHSHELWKVTRLVGIHADESHRAKPVDGVRYPLVELGYGQEECVDIITRAGLPVPPKSGCWHCPFMRKAEIIQLSISAPCRFEAIVALEDNAEAVRGTRLNHWGNKSAREWRDGGALFADASNDIPCGCMDGDSVVLTDKETP